MESWDTSGEMIVGDFPFKGKSEKDLYKSEKRVSCEKILKFDWFNSNKEEKEQISVRVVKFDKENKNLIEALKFLNYNKKKEDN